MGGGLETSSMGRNALEEGKPDIQGQNSPSNSEPQHRGFWKPVDRTGEGIPSGQPGPCLCLLQSLSCWRAGPVAFFLLSLRKISPPSALHEPLRKWVCGGGLCGRHVPSAQRGLLTCLSVPSNPAPSKGGSGLGMAGKGLLGIVQPGPPLESGGATVTFLVSKEHAENLRACLI